MAELGQLEKRHQDFASRNVRIVVISNDDQRTAQETQADFPHLIVIADTSEAMAKAFEAIHPGMGPGGKDTNAPTTWLVDGSGTVSWMFRPDRFIIRLPPDELLAAIDAKWKG